MDVIVDAMDNYPTRYLLHRAAIDQGIPLVHGAIHGLGGRPHHHPRQDACLRWVFPHPPRRRRFRFVGVALEHRHVQATEVLKYLLGTGTPLETGWLSGRSLLQARRDPSQQESCLGRELQQSDTKEGR